MHITMPSKPERRVSKSALLRRKVCCARNNFRLQCGKLPLAPVKNCAFALDRER